jgi:acetolactate synthase-1/2/3 large subunit
VVVTVDAGAHMLAVMPLWETDAPGRLLISSGLATMGYALPAAIAAALSTPAHLVIACTGDGGLGMTLAELETAVRLKLRIAVVVFNDATLSLIKIKQRPAGQGGAEAVDFGPVSYAVAAQAMGAAAAAVGTESELAAAISAAAGRDGPTVIDVRTDPASYPAIMELSRGETGRQPVPGLPEPVPPGARLVPPGARPVPPGAEPGAPTSTQPTSTQPTSARPTST